MITTEIKKKYYLTIGIETHVQLKTKTKLFAAVDNDSSQAPPNTNVSHICFGLPGALPVLNQEAVKLAIKAAFSLGTTPAKFSKFDRKHYFYPDLPKGYQISQFDEPIITEGFVSVPKINEAGQVDGILRVGITRAHLEEDAGKSSHPVGQDYSLVDLNRCGTPLLEIVSEPDMHDSSEAKAYVRELYLRMKYAVVSDCDLYLGHMRFDVNVSVSKDKAKLGTRTETKNLNSFRNVEKAIEYELNRQIDLLEKGHIIVQETRGWDEAKQRTFSQRTKEEAHDYRYMPDPDLPPIILDDSYIESIKVQMPPLPDDFRRKFENLKVDRRVIEDIIAQPSIAKLIWRVIDQATVDDARRIAFWMLGSVPKEGGEQTSEMKANDLELIKLSQLVSQGRLSSTAAKTVFDALKDSGGQAEQIAQAKKLIQVSDKEELSKIVSQVLEQQPKAAEDVKNGEMKAIGFLVGQVMKLSNGQANPSLVQRLIKEHLDVS